MPTLPTWSTPATKASGDTITAADWNSAMDAARWLYWRPAAVVWRSSDMSITDSTYTAIQFDTDIYDPYGFHSTVSNTSRLTVPAGLAGTYRICGRWGDWAGSGAGRGSITIRLNGTTDIGRSAHWLAAVGAATSWTSTHYDLAAGDYVELRAYQDSGATVAVPGDVLGPFFSISHLGTT